MSPPRGRLSTVPGRKPPKRPRVPLPPKPSRPGPPSRPASPKSVPRRTVARIIDDSETSLLDVVDNLLNRGVLLNAEVILSLANVDLVYLRLSALLCAADRILPRRPR
jgi:Gas vesicle protein